MGNISSQLYGPDGNKIQYSLHQYRRQAAKKTGSMTNWTPSKIWGDISGSAERVFIAERATDLIQSDPHAAGVVNVQANTIIGSGLKPNPQIDYKRLKITKEQARQLQVQQRLIYKKWAKTADAGERMTAGMIQFLLQRNLLQYGEFLVLLPMIKAPNRHYSLACQVINPLRLKTPSDMTHRSDIRDGVEIGNYGQAIAYWIKKRGDVGTYVSDSSSNFMRIVAKKGHRRNVIHGYIMEDAEQFRGYSPFAAAMKTFRDNNDYLDAELVSNVVTAAYALFVETGETEPYFPATNLATLTNEGIKSDGSSYDMRYEEFEPGQIMYGNSGEKPHVISASRPGTTFEPFTRNVKKMLSMESGIPYNVLFRDFDGMSYASFRSAMLEAWRIFSAKRSWMGQMFCQPVHTMLIEEAFLRGEYDAKDFYLYMDEYTEADWIGSPKGQIEPIKEVQADIYAIQNNLKTRYKTILERDGLDAMAVFDDLEEEQEMLSERGLTEEKITNE